MINFSIYILSFIASTLIIATAPKEALHEYVLTYNAMGVVFSLALFLYYSYAASARRSRYVYTGFVVAGIFLVFTLGTYYSALLIYPGLLIFSDYIATQSFGIKVVTAYRLLMIASVTPFIFTPENFEYNIIIRVVMLLLVLAVFIFIAKRSERLATRSPLRFLIGNYAFYNGTLALLALVVTDAVVLRYWYIASQIGLVLILKLLDYSLRRSYNLDKYTKYSVLIAAGLLPIPVFVFFPNILALALFYVGYGGLIFTGRFIHQ